MLVVSDATPINILVRIELIEVLPRLFGEILVPPAVVRELSNPRAPEPLRSWIAGPPGWFKIKAPALVASAMEIGAGEREAIALAAEYKADLLLIDDLEARRHALRLGLRITGTIGVLELADAKGLASLPSAVERVRATDFKVSSKILDEALARHRARTGAA